MSGYRDHGVLRTYSAPDRRAIQPMSQLSVREFPDFDRSGVKMTAPDADETLSFYDDRWLCAWARAFLPDRGWARPLTVYSVVSGDTTLGYFGLAQQTLSRLRVRSLAGYYWPFRTMAVCDDDDNRQAFATSVAKHFSRSPPATVLRFGPVSSLDKAIGALLRSLIGNGWTALRRDDGQSFVLKLPEEVAAFESGISHSLLKNVRYCRRRMEKQFGSVGIQRYVLGPESDEALDIVGAIENASWISKEHGDLKFVGAANRKFWTSLGAAPEQRYQAVIWILRCDTVPVAFSAHLETLETIYIIANSYDERWKPHSPGSVLSLELLSDACRRGKKQVDWGQGDSGYKSRWGAVPSACLFDVMLFRPGIRGHLMRTLAQRFLPAWHVLEHV